MDLGEKVEGIKTGLRQNLRSGACVSRYVDLMVYDTLQDGLRPVYWRPLDQALERSMDTWT
jgi:hypothetical protein